IQNFLDAVNSVLLTIQKLTAVDEDKETTSNDPNDKGNKNYSKSTLTAEKGGLLTGNYGVQLVKSRFISLVNSTPPGFQAMATADDMLSGDVLSCLANLGVKTDTNTTSQTYGLLVIAPQSALLQQMDDDNYQDMINNHINELVDFFVSSGKGISSSADFRYSSHVEGITGAGVFDVKYDVDANGQISNVTIGGEPCARDETRGGYYYTCTAGDARGLAISIDDLTQGSHSGQVRIKQGLVQTVQNFLDKELTFHDVNVSANAPQEILDAQLSMKSENGAMMNLKSNYANIMKNIDKSIDKEQRRLDTWYNRQKNIFSNLETLLRTLDEQKTSLEAQLEQLK
ncbi:MAG: flagellar filament capping protein FliD, partial [Desulfovibrio sp.]|nr:flagellar filament capping protein FliD [Desulfovibrio sp.]